MLARLVAVAAGLVSALSLGPWGWWPLGVGGLGVLYTITSQIDRPLRRFALTWWFMVGYFVLGVAFIIDLTAPGYVIAVPTLAAIMAAPHVVPGPPSLRGVAFVAALVVGEAWRWVVPFGGVPLGGLALGQVNGPFLAVASTAGALGVLATTATAAVALAELVMGRRRSAGVACAVAGLLLVTGYVDPSSRPVGDLTVAAVQGGGQLGTNAETSDQQPVFTRHLEASQDLPDGALVLWPESAVTVDGEFEGSRRHQQLAELARSTNTTLVVGVTQRDETSFDNLSVVIAPDGSVVDSYQKVHLVPFGEYIPFRSFVGRFADLSLVPRDAVPGEGAGYLWTPAGQAAIGISWEIYFWERIRSGVREGGELVLNPTLASSYTTTHVPEQSLAAARIRAVETGRWVVQASTTGYTAIVDPNGRVVERSGLREQVVLTADIERRSGETLATRLGKFPLTLLSLLALTGLSLWRPGRGSESNLDDDGDGTIVDDVDDHLGPEPAGGDPQA